MIQVNLHVRPRTIITTTPLPTAHCHTVDLTSDDVRVFLFVQSDNAQRVREYAHALLEATDHYLPESPATQPQTPPQYAPTQRVAS